VKQVEKTGGTALGLLENAQYRSGRLVLGPGEAILLYTDGVTEAMDVKEELFSDQRLQEVLTRIQLSVSRKLVGKVVDEVKIFSAGAPQSDDITALALQYVGSAERMGEDLVINLKNSLSELNRMSQAVNEFGVNFHLSPQGSL
jgi:sigma-B regulation protein RsbU (phosphoserine phosphatase)